MRDWVTSFPSDPAIVLDDWDEFCVGTPDVGVIAETSYVDTFVTLPLELQEARERLKHYVPDEDKLTHVSTALFNAPRYCLRMVDGLLKAEGEINKCHLHFCASDYCTFLVTNGMDERWANIAGLKDAWKNPHQWALKWTSDSGMQFFENSFGVNVLITVRDDHGECLALFRQRGGKTAVRYARTIGSADEGLRRRSKDSLYDEKSPTDPAPNLIRAAMRAVEEEVGLTKELIGDSRPVLLTVGRVKSLYQPAALFYWPLQFTTREIRQSFRTAVDNRYEFSDHYFVPFRRDPFVSFVLDQEKTAPVESWVAVMTLLALGSVGAKKKSVFLSHSSRDKPFVRALANRLHNEGFKVWLDEAEIGPGDSLVEKLSSAIVRDVDCVVAVISNNSCNSPWVTQELEWAVTRGILDRRFVVFPVLKDNCQIPKIFSGKAYADVRSRYRKQKSLDSLVRKIRALK